MAIRNTPAASTHRRTDIASARPAARGFSAGVQSWPVSRIKVGRRYRKKLGDIPALCSSIQELGLLHPVTITPDGTLLAGECRLAAVQKLGWSEIEVKILKTA